MRFLIIFLLLWSTVNDFLSSRLSVLGYIDEIIVFALLVHLLMYAVANAGKNRTEIRIAILPVLIGLLLIWILGSFIINLSSLSQLFKFVLSFSKGFVIFYWIKTFINKEKILAEVVIIVKWLILIQIPFFIIGLIMYRSDYIGDNAVGAVITGGAASVATYFWMGIIICIAKYEQVKDRLYLMLAVGLSLLLVVTSTKQLTILLPIVLIYLYGKKIKIANLKQMAFLAVGLIAVVMLYNAVERKWMLNYGVDSSQVNLLDYMDESEKLQGYYSLLFELPTEIKHPLMSGAGPGMYGSYVAMNSRTPLSDKYIMDYYDMIPEGLGGTLAYRSSSVIAFWGDTGLVGLILIFTIYLYVTFYHAARLKSISNRVLHDLIIASGFLLIAQSFILNVFEGNTFTLNLFWILCGISAAGAYKSKESLSSEVCD